MPITPASGRAAPEATLDASPEVRPGRRGGSAEPGPQPGPEGLASLSARRREAGQPSRPASPMRPHRVELAGYLLDRQVVGRPITDPDTLRMLKDGNDSMQATREKLVHSNVIPAVEKTGNESYVRGAIAQRIGKHAEPALDPADLANQQTALIAALGDLVHAGACDTFASDVVHGHAPKLQAGESIERVAATNFHSWVQLHAPGKPDVDLDAWAPGSAMLAEDRTLAIEHSQGHVHDPQKAARDLQRARAMVLTPAFEQYTQDCLALGRGMVPPPEQLFEPTHFVNPALPALAEQVLANLPEQEQLRLATQVALQLGVAPEAAARAAPDILDAARNLHRQ